MTKRKKWVLFFACGVSGIVLATIAAWLATSHSISPEEAERGWPDKWVPVTIRSGNEWKLDFAWRDRLYTGRLSWPWYVKVSFKDSDGKTTDGSVPEGCLISNVGTFYLVPPGSGSND